MANNRLWLVYRPTGKAVFLGKRMSEGWYGTPEDVADRIYALFDHVQDNYTHEIMFSQDDFMICMEQGNSKFVNTDWKYTEGVTGIPLATLEIEK